MYLVDVTHVVSDAPPPRQCSLFTFKTLHEHSSLPRDDHRVGRERAEELIKSEIKDRSAGGGGASKPHQASSITIFVSLILDQGSRETTKCCFDVLSHLIRSRVCVRTRAGVYVKLHCSDAPPVLSRQSSPRARVLFGLLSRASSSSSVRSPWWHARVLPPLPAAAAPRTFDPALACDKKQL